MSDRCKAIIGTINTVPGTWGKEAIIIRTCTYPQGPCLCDLVGIGVINMGDVGLSSRKLAETIRDFSSSQAGITIEVKSTDADVPIGHFHGDCENVQSERRRQLT